ncbi:M20/M25/M40 family metallo-hydrolase [Mesorhizobium sp. M7A.F.Ca.US.006.01.1.1]|uniref:M20 family metallopeptidase n=1 Tax=Mesorhizobium sp. M7A.F.Ca.US.006.01.1.1 TaxID=2496707 RepID=UPI000FCC9A8A|nr:M20/M25/M40 family metallo-hydrolase [Mesorhizobium sp. M7A.F.Ca.US.006.01.1.1]RUZ79394.1 M20/M25/M40 family metallo-hydrolase [Mesorhizobium sp. M7A.F.Ca.US.006.01.1.1]
MFRNSVGAAIDEAIDAPALIAACQEVVRIESLTGQEANVAKFVAEKMIELSFDDVKIDANGNVIGTVFGDGTGPSVMINGHIDHVPVGAMQNPFSGELVDAARWGESGQAIFGRGSCDMKCNVISAIYAVGALRRSGLKPGGDVIVVADVEEETDSPKGVKAVIESGIRADYGISVESTRGQVYLGHRGKLEFEVCFHGRTSHASEPSNGVNAIYLSTAFIGALEQYASTLPEDELLGPATVVVTGMHSFPDNGTAVVPDLVKMRVDRRYIRGEDEESCLSEIRQILKSAYGETEGGKWSAEVTNHYPLMFTPQTSLVAQAAIVAALDVDDAAPAISAWRFGVNGTFMNAAGIPTIGLGPGDEKWAHTPEEHVGTADLVNSTRKIARAVMALTKSGEA